MIRLSDHGHAVGVDLQYAARPGVGADSECFPGLVSPAVLADDSGRVFRPRVRRVDVDGEVVKVVDSVHNSFIN